jgi:hypothetical protein
MFLATVNKSKQLLHLSFIDEVRVEELVESRDELVTLIADLKPGFRLLTDLGRLDSMGLDCAAEIGKSMELCDQRGVGMIVRVIPDPMKDIGLNILSLFHYSHRPRTVTCESMVEAAKLLSLSPARNPK